MELADYLKVLRAHWTSVCAIALGCVLMAGVMSLLMRPTYTATTSIFLSVRAVSTAGELSAGSNYAENQVQSFARVVRTPVVLQPVIDELGLDITAEELAEKVTATVPTSTATIDISVVDGDADQSARIANLIAQNLVATVQTLAPPATDGTEMVEATIIRPASAPTSPTTPKVAQNLALGLLIGLMLGVGQAILRDTLDARVRTEHDVERVTDRPILGAVEYDINASEDATSVWVDSHSTRAETYRRIRTNLQFLGMADGNRAIVVTSSIPGEGKTTTALNLAHTLAAAGERVLLVDADLRRPQLATYLGLEGAAGLTSVLIGEATFDEVVQPCGDDGLDVLASGPIPPNPSELLGFSSMRSLLAEATQRYDTVIIDSPPLLPVADATVLARSASGAVVVAGCRAVRRPQLAASLEALDQVDARVLGVVLNKVQVRDDRRYGYYGYSYESSQEEPRVVDNLPAHSAGAQTRAGAAPTRAETTHSRIPAGR